MRQRVGIARALAVRPAILLMDEPLSALDSQTRELLMEDFIRLLADGAMGAVYVTHNLEEAVRLADRIVVLSRRPGRVRSLVLQGVGPRLEPGPLQQVAGLVLSRYPLPEDNPFVNQFFNLFFGSKQKPGPLFDFVTRQCWQTDQSVMAHRFRLAEQVDFADRCDTDDRGTAAAASVGADEAGGDHAGGALPVG